MPDITAVLFDIDGTLLDMRGVGRESFVRALEVTFGIKDDLHYISFAGNTDLNVLHGVMARHRLPLTRDDCDRFHRQLPLQLAAAAHQAELILYPGVRELLEALSVEPDVLLGLVTGNVEACAWIKLQQFNLHNHFVLGAFGDEHADRNEIARMALQRVQARMEPGQSMKACFLVGDTPNDINAAHAIGAVSVAVATGKFTVADLKAAGADVVLPDLSNTPCVTALFR
jgi:phosphoglycolate phosphatase-like HAD superfamily hydrolase